MVFSKSTARTNFYIETTQLQTIQDMARETGAPMSEVVRRLLARGIESFASENITTKV